MNDFRDQVAIACMREMLHAITTAITNGSEVAKAEQDGIARFCFAMADSMERARIE